jgi:hypothetical protein
MPMQDIGACVLTGAPPHSAKTGLSAIVFCTETVSICLGATCAVRQFNLAKPLPGKASGRC